MIFILLYLVAIVLANLSVGYFGVNALYINAFLFIGLDLTARDKLHDAWHGKYLWLKMTALVFTGSLLSWLLNSSVAQIAFASFVAFMAAGVVDTLTYQLLFKRRAMVRINGSNVFSAMVDSLIFPTIAFGAIMPMVVIGQFAAKVVGGFVWAYLLGKLKLVR